MSDEEVSLGSSTPDLKAPVAAQPRKQANSLKGSISGAMSNADVVDLIMATPAEQIIPWEDATLPSGGFFYGWPNGEIKVRAWGAEVDKILATQRLAQSGQSVNMMIERCVKYPAGFTTDNLLVGDQVFLLYYLRGITYGNIYEFMVTTPSKRRQIYEIDLNDLSKTVKMGNPSLGPEPFKVSLPYLSEKFGRDIWVSVKFLRVRDQKVIQQQQQQWKRLHSDNLVRVGDDDDYQDPFVGSEQLDDSVTRNMSFSIVNIMGEVEDRFKIQQFVEQLHSQDIATIRTWIRDNTPGIDPVVTLTDPESGQEFKVPLPITESFFRRTDGRGARR